MGKGKKARKHAMEEEGTGQEDSPQDLYKVLGVCLSATQAKIKKAYHQMALKLHPDKNPDDEGAKEKFQTLQRVYKILSDPEKRALYDKTGDIEDVELSGEHFDNLYEYYRTVYRKVTPEDIESFELSYRGSEEEAEDLKRYYKQFKGNMDMVFSWLMCSDPASDAHRSMDVLDAAMEAGTLKSYPRYQKWAEKVKQAPAPREDKPRPSKTAKATDGAQEGSLMAMIKSRQMERNNDLFDSLEARYASTGKKKKTRAPEPTDAEFEAAQARVVKKKKKQQAS